MIFGGVIIVFALYIPVSFEFKGEDQVYFSCIIAGSILFFLGSAGKVKEIYTQSVLLALGSAQFMLLIIDSLNIFCDACIATKKYFIIVLTIFFATLIILLIIRLWLRRILMFLKF